MSTKVRISITEHDGRRYASTGSRWESMIGYSRAVRVDDSIFVTGTVGVEPDGSFAPTAKEQARRALAIIAAAIEALGGMLTDVVRTRIYLTDMAQWREVGEMHAEFLGRARPAITLVQVARLIDDKALVEIEADAILAHQETEMM